MCSWSSPFVCVSTMKVRIYEHCTYVTEAFLLLLLLMIKKLVVIRHVVGRCAQLQSQQNSHDRRTEAASSNSCCNSTAAIRIWPHINLGPAGRPDDQSSSYVEMRPHPLNGRCASSGGIHLLVYVWLTRGMYC